MTTSNSSNSRSNPCGVHSPVSNMGGAGGGSQSDQSGPSIWIPHNPFLPNMKSNEDSDHPSDLNLDPSFDQQEEQGVHNFNSDDFNEHGRNGSSSNSSPSTPCSCQRSQQPTSNLKSFSDHGPWEEEYYDSNLSPSSQIEDSALPVDTPSHHALALEHARSLARRAHQTSKWAYAAGTSAAHQTAADSHSLVAASYHHIQDVQGYERHVNLAKEHTAEATRRMLDRDSYSPQGMRGYEVPLRTTKTFGAVHNSPSLLSTHNVRPRPAARRSPKAGRPRQGTHLESPSRERLARIYATNAARCSLKAKAAYDVANANNQSPQGIETLNAIRYTRRAYKRPNYNTHNEAALAHDLAANAHETLASYHTANMLSGSPTTNGSQGRAHAAAAEQHRKAAEEHRKALGAVHNNVRHHRRHSRSHTSRSPLATTNAQWEEESVGTDRPRYKKQDKWRDTAAWADQASQAAQVLTKKLARANPEHRKYYKVAKTLSDSSNYARMHSTGGPGYETPKGIKHAIGVHEGAAEAHHEIADRLERSPSTNNPSLHQTTIQAHRVAARHHEEAAIHATDKLNRLLSPPNRNPFSANSSIWTRRISAPGIDAVSLDDYSYHPPSEPSFEGQYTRPQHRNRLRGYNARGAGLDRLANPHPAGSLEHSQWREGWDDHHFIHNPETYEVQNSLTSSTHNDNPHIHAAPKESWLGDDDWNLGAIARRELEESGQNPVSWVKDESKWEKAKKAAAKEYGSQSHAYWPVVTSIYKKMGGKIKHHSKTHNHNIHNQVPPIPHNAPAIAPRVTPQAPPRIANPPAITKPATSGVPKGYVPKTSGPLGKTYGIHNLKEVATPETASMGWGTITNYRLAGKTFSKEDFGQAHPTWHRAMKMHNKRMALRESTQNASIPSISNTPTEVHSTSPSTHAPTSLRAAAHFGQWLKYYHNRIGSRGVHPSLTPTEHHDAAMESSQTALDSNSSSHHFIADIRHRRAASAFRQAASRAGGAVVQVGGAPARQISSLYNKLAAMHEHTARYHNYQSKQLQGPTGNAHSAEAALGIWLAHKALEHPAPNKAALARSREALVHSGAASSPEHHAAASEAHTRAMIAHGESSPSYKYHKMAADVHRAISVKGPQFWYAPEERIPEPKHSFDDTNKGHSSSQGQAFG